MKIELLLEMQYSLDKAERELCSVKNSLPKLINGMEEGTSHDEIASELLDIIMHINTVRSCFNGMTFGYLNREVNEP